MVARRFFLVGLAFIAIGVSSFIILLFYSSLPKRSIETVPLMPPPNCRSGCGSGGGGVDTITGIPTWRLRIEEEWPDQIDIKGSDSISVLLAKPQLSGGELLTPADNRKTMTGTPFLVGDNPDAPLGSVFGTGYEAYSATAHLVATTFNIQALGPEEQAINQTSIEWTWDISPKALGTQVIGLDIEVRWKPTSKGGREDILRQVWQSQMVVRIYEPLLAVEQISIGALVTGFVSFIGGVGLTIPWIWELIQKRQKEKKKTKGTKATDQKQKRMKDLIWKHIEKRGRKRRRRRRLRRQAKRENLNGLVTNLAQYTTSAIVHQGEPGQQAISRRTLLRWLGWGAAGAIGGGIVWLVFSGRLRIFTPQGTLLYTLHPTSGAQSVAWLPDDQHLAFMNDKGAVEVWKLVDKGKFIYTYHGDIGDVASFALSPDGRYLAFGNDEGIVEVWDIMANGRVYTYQGHSTKFVWSIAWSPDGKYIAFGSEDATVQVWDAVGGSHLYTYHGHTDSVNSVVWSPDGVHIASGSDDGTVQVWNATNGNHAYIYRQHCDAVSRVAWSLDGRRLASACNIGADNGVVRVWDVSDNGYIYIYKGHSDLVSSVAWSPNGRHITSASYDGTVQIWDATNGNHAYTFVVHAPFWPNRRILDEYSIDVAWSFDGTRIASSWHNTVQLWQAV